MSNMEPSSSDVSGMESQGGTNSDSRDFRYSDGTLAGDITVHSANQADGSVRAQLELRFEDFKCALTAPEVGLLPPGHSTGRTWVLVEVEPRQSYTDTLRFSIDIPGKAGRTGEDVGDAQTALAQLDGAYTTLAAMQTRCGDTKQGNYLLSVLDALRSTRQLADDGSESSLVTLASQPLHAPSADS